MGTSIGDGIYAVEVEGGQGPTEFIYGEENATMLAKRLGGKHPGKAVRVFKLRETHYFEPKWPKGVVPQ